MRLLPNWDQFVAKEAKGFIGFVEVKRRSALLKIPHKMKA